MNRHTSNPGRPRAGRLITRIGLALALALAAPTVAPATPGAVPQANQDSVRVTAGLTTGVVKLGAPVELRVTIDGSLDGRIDDLPEVPGLTFGRVSGPSPSQSMRSVNGRVTVIRRATFSIPVQAAAAGDYEIPPFLIEVGDDRFQTNPMSLRVRADLAGADLGLLELEVSPERLVVGQPFDVTVTFGWDADLSARVNHADLSLPWWGQLPGAIEVEGSGDRRLGARYTTVNLNGRSQLEVEMLGTRERRGRPFTSYQVTRSFLATHAGVMEFPASHLEFGRMSQGSFFENPRPIEMYYVSATPTLLEVGTLPEEGRPFAFNGAVGTLTAQAEVDRREVDAGDSIKLRVEWSGDGNLEFFRLPDLDHDAAFEGFRVYGATDEIKGRFQRVAVFDLAPVDAGVSAIPPVPLVVFDPAKGSYETVRTEPIPIRVRALAGSGLDVEPEGELVEDIRDLAVEGFSGRAATEPAVQERRFARSAIGGLGASALAILAWGLLRPRVRAGRDPAGPLERRRRRAPARLRRELRRAAGAADARALALARHRALCGYLAARTREDEAAWVGRDPLRWVPAAREAGLAEPLAVRLATALEALERAAFGPIGDGPPPPSDTQLCSLAKDLVKGSGGAL